MRPTPEYETRVVIAGQEYHAQTCSSLPGHPRWLGSCTGCAFHTEHGCHAPLPYMDMPCLRGHRSDNTSIIWVKA